ncbi:hypothetical protein CEXT_139831 [Caerostris extrusa]|uniref:Uncharacterized protein n=1 Tax=Caerostris extrusa TaxID=172846 RepID=A0AAV4X4H4_CAEEX|nr:hypothetical protein CEXT_139831 [Caerostris extrusa]
MASPRRGRKGHPRAGVRGGDKILTSPHSSTSRKLQADSPHRYPDTFNESSLQADSPHRYPDTFNESSLQR